APDRHAVPMRETLACAKKWQCHGRLFWCCKTIQQILVLALDINNDLTMQQLLVSGGFYPLQKNVVRCVFPCVRIQRSLRQDLSGSCATVFEYHPNTLQRIIRCDV